MQIITCNMLLLLIELALQRLLVLFNHLPEILHMILHPLRQHHPNLLVLFAPGHPILLHLLFSLLRHL